MSFELAVIMAGAFTAAFAVGATGFADALVASAFFLHVLEPADAVPLIVATGIVMHGLSLMRVRRELDLARIGPFLAGGVFGVPVGAWALGHVEPEWFRLGIGIFLIVYSVFMLARPFAGTITGGGRAADALIGLTGGVLGGLAGLSGVAPTVWSRLRGWSRHEQRAVYQPFILGMHLMTLGWLAWGGYLDAGLGRNFLWCLPAAVLGVWSGLQLYRRLDEALFGRIVLILLLASGAALAV